MRTTKKCAFCGKEFFASEATKVERVPRSGMQKYCCEDCQAKAKAARKKKQRDFMNAVEPVIDIQQQEYLTFAKAALLMGCSRQYVYKLVNEGKLAASRISSRMAFIRKADIEEMLAGHPYHRVLPTSRPKIPKAPSKTEKDSIKSAEQDASVLDYISGEEVMRIYKVKKSWLYTSAKNNQVPICRIGGRNYYSRKHMDLLFSLTVEASEVKEWVTAKEAEELYGIKPGILHACAYRHHIPTKREYGKTYYAKDQLDALRRTDLTGDDRYCTAKEAAEKYGMTVSNVCIIAKKNNVATVRVGVKNLLMKEDLERVMAKRLEQFGSYRIALGRP